MLFETIAERMSPVRGRPTVRERAVGVGGGSALVVLSGLALATGVTWKLLAISWVGFGAMALGVPFGVRAAAADHPLEPVWGYGLASGAMVTSTAVFLIPQALAQHGRFGGLGIAAGFLTGYAGHALGHRVAHLDLPVDHTAAELTIHALAAGGIIGAIYGTMPSLTALLGVALVSHKAPAGYAAARRLAGQNRSVAVLGLPAAAVGLVALPVGMVGVDPPSVVRGLLFGVGAGVFLHVAVDLLPECTAGSETCPTDAEADGHRLRDRLRTHAAVSAVLGGAVVAVGWLLVG